jgi:hypothetical protein
MFAEIQNTKGLWASTSGFRGLGFREYKSQTSTHTTTPEIVKGDQYFRISEFGISLVQVPKQHTRTSENVKRERWDPHLRVSGFETL